MGESAIHSHLVISISDWIRQQYAGANPGLYVLSDVPTSRPGDRPRPIKGFVPDVFAGTSPRSFTLIGEAKCAPDLFTQRSENQLRAFVNYLAAEEEPVLVIATPWVLRATARNMVQRLIQTEGAEHIALKLLTPC